MQEDDVVLRLGYVEACETLVTVLTAIKHDRLEVDLLPL